MEGIVFTGRDVTEREQAAEVNADLIGMTAHGLSGVSRWVYGNVASKVLQGSLCPVLLVRPSSD